MGSQKLVYIECCNKTIYLHFTDYALELCYQLSALEQKLTNYGFIRVHKGYLVNYRFIFCIEKNFILLDTPGANSSVQTSSHICKKRIYQTDCLTARGEIS